MSLRHSYLPCSLVKLVPHGHSSLTPTCPTQTFHPNTHVSDKRFGGQVGVGGLRQVGVGGWRQVGGGR